MSFPAGGGARKHCIAGVGCHTVLFVIFGASGCAALIYEMVWFHLVQLVVGASSISVAVLLCSFMGGMALGSWFLPRLVLATVSPLRAIAALEAGIAALGLLIPLVLPFVQQAYVAVVGYGFGAVLLRAAVCAVILTPPTMLMGATLPIAARLRDVDVGRLYTMNLAGGAIGTVIAGFYLLRVFDVYVASGVAVALNGAVAVAAWRLSSHTAPLAPLATSAPNAPDAPYAPYALYGAAALSGFTALGAEVVWTRQLSLLFGASVYTFSLILAVFLGGLAIGGSIGARVAQQSAEPAVALGRVQLALALAIATGAWLIVNLLPHWQPTRSFLPAIHASPLFTFGFDALRCAVAMLPATILWGVSFPLTIAAALRLRRSFDRPRSAQARGSDTGRSVAAINALNTAGALAGAVVLTLVGIPRFGSQIAQQALVVGAALTGTVVLLSLRSAASVFSVISVASVVTAISVFSVPEVPGHLIAFGRSVNSWASIKRFLYLEEGATASVAVTEGVAGAKQFHIAGKVEASDMDVDMRLERMLGHVPALLHPHPRSILIVGVGAGVTAGALSIHPEVERIVICEIERVVPESARLYFGDENHHVFDDPRVELVFDDARHFLQTTTETFDIITSDPIHPWVRGAATLYSLEYLQLARAHLNPGGIVTQWIPLYETDLRSVKSEIATFAQVFPDTTLWNPDLLEEGYDLVALGRVAAHPISEAAIDARIGMAPRVQNSLDAVKLPTAAAVLATYAGRARDLLPLLADAEINRERHLRLQYLAGLAANRDQRYYIFQELVKYRRYPADLFVASAQVEQQLRRWYAP
jgi:spermidine synthase